MVKMSKNCPACDISWLELHDKNKSIAQQIHDHLILANTPYCIYCRVPIKTIIRKTLDVSACDQMKKHIEMHLRYDPQRE